ncbi:MAG: hypothetical protein LUE93_10175 [Bacteroides sp.]|nr:hypothetical protein [Bacteroides sp.]
MKQKQPEEMNREELEERYPVLPVSEEEKTEKHSVEDVQDEVDEINLDKNTRERG